ncbi:interleukin-12 subunit beta isoform D [Patagioenas fasciata monilis]|uniref:Interleukin-12 subunit beta n=1 Tax=Patagioenas fasciata monilis TaxID=372326 RepID=A0A1V4KUX5_PATFA|nr:interleukin-12 subunit beta isoform D [Patagioenas fasciata monilis]
MEQCQARDAAHSLRRDRPLRTAWTSLQSWVQVSFHETAHSSQVSSDKLERDLIPAQVQEFTDIGQQFHLCDSCFFCRPVVVRLLRMMSEPREEQEEHNSKYEQLQTYPHTPWRDGKPQQKYRHQPDAKRLYHYVKKELKPCVAILWYCAQEKMSHILFALLSLFSFPALLEAQWKLRENVYVIESEWNDVTPAKRVKLTCNTPDEALPVYWKKGTELKGTGKTFIAEVKEFPDAGNYTCLRADTHEIISYEFFLITKVDSNGQMIRSMLRSFEEPNRTFLKCEAKNYSGIFKCSWMTENESPNVKFTIRSLKGSQGDVTCSSPVAHTDESVTEYTAQCQKENYCPFAEEHQPTEMFLEVIDEVEYENYTSSFFIRDIIKPDPPQCQYVATNGTVTWTYPRTWSTPKSYFPLTFRVKAESTEEHKIQVEVYEAEEQSFQIPIAGPKTRISVQARDRYYNSSWSEWSSLCR